MLPIDLIKSFIIALSIGVLIGVERERRKASRAVPVAAGVRTFAVTALLGALAMAVGGVTLLAIATLCVAAFTAISYWRSRDEDLGLTTEFALIATCLLGGQALDQPALALALGVVITILLAARQPMHRFIGAVMTEGELADLLILAGATLVILPMLPDRSMGPFQAINPHDLWIVAILILGINAAGQIITRWLGGRLGVPLLGLASGFVSSSATIGAMGAWVRGAPMAMRAGAAGAVLSTVATFVQLGVVIWMTDRQTFASALAPLFAAIAAAGAAGGLLTLLSWRHPLTTMPDISRGFGIVMALVFSLTLGAMLILVAGLRDWLGAPGMIMAAAIGGVLDVHAAAIAIAAQVASGALPPQAALLPLLVSWTTSTAAKILFAASAGPRDFAGRVIVAQFVILAAAWAAAALTGGLT